MKKTAIPLLLALITTACSAKDDFSGEYQRLKASEFEVKHNMNTSASIAHKDGQYLVVLHLMVVFQNRFCHTLHHRSYRLQVRRIRGERKGEFPPFVVDGVVFPHGEADF